MYRGAGETKTITKGDNKQRERKLGDDNNNGKIKKGIQIPQNEWTQDNGRVTYLLGAKTKTKTITKKVRVKNNKQKQRKRKLDEGDDDNDDNNNE